MGHDEGPTVGGGRCIGYPAYLPRRKLQPPEMSRLSLSPGQVDSGETQQKSKRSIENLTLSTCVHKVLYMMPQSLSSPQNENERSYLFLAVEKHSAEPQPRSVLGQTLSPHSSPQSRNLRKLHCTQPPVEQSRRLPPTNLRLTKPTKPLTPVKPVNRESPARRAKSGISKGGRWEVLTKNSVDRSKKMDSGKAAVKLVKVTKVLGRTGL